MAVLTAKGISGVAIEMLQRQVMLLKTVTMVPGNEFIGPNGGTITVRVPSAEAARTQGSAGASLTADTTTEVGVDVALAHLYHLYNLSDQEAAYSLEDFARQITRPQVQALARGAENELISVMNALTPDDGTIAQFALSASDADTKAQMLALHKFMTDNEVPAEDRYFAVGPTLSQRLLTSSEFTRADGIGTGNAMRTAKIGRIYGFDVIEVAGITTDHGIAYHKSGFVSALRQPELPRGATESFGINEQGVALRQVFQYDPSTAQDQSLVSTFAGAAAVYEDGTGGSDNDRFIAVDIATS